MRKTMWTAACLALVFWAVMRTESAYAGNSGDTAWEDAACVWAEAFCGRDGDAYYELYNPEEREEFYDLEYIQSGPEDRWISMGMSSPWPMDFLYSVQKEGNRSVFTYYAKTSDPHRWAWRQEVSWREADGVWYGREESFSWNERIVSAKEFENAYGENGISGTPMDYRTGDAEQAAALERLAASDEIYRSILTDPALSMEYLLNLHGGTGEWKAQKDGSAAVNYRFADGSQSAVIMVPSGGELTVWLPGEYKGSELPAQDGAEKNREGQFGGFMTFRLPRGLQSGEVMEEEGRSLCLFFPDNAVLGAERNLRTAVGAAVRYDGELSAEFENGRLKGFRGLKEQFSCASEPVFLEDCETPAMQVLVECSFPDEKTGEMRSAWRWAVFLGSPDSRIVYGMFLDTAAGGENASRELARSAHFSDRAWEEPSGEIICGYVHRIEEDRIVIDPAEYIEPDEERRIRSLGLTEEELVSGYYIFNPENEEIVLALVPGTVYSFIDWGRDFGNSDRAEDLRISTTDREMFREYLATYRDGIPGMPFFFEVLDGKAIRVTERPMA